MRQQLCVRGNEICSTETETNFGRLLKLYFSLRCLEEFSAGSPWKNAAGRRCAIARTVGWY